LPQKTNFRCCCAVSSILKTGQNDRRHTNPKRHRGPWGKTS
jgi:hypothetical protein